MYIYIYKYIYSNMYLDSQKRTILWSSWERAITTSFFLAKYSLPVMAKKSRIKRTLQSYPQQNRIFQYFVRERL